MIDKKLILDAYNWRHACKEFDSTKKITREDLEFLLNTVSLSPSSFGLQPFEVFVIANQDILKELHPHMWGAQKQFFSASQIVMFATKKDVTINDEYFEHILVDVQDTPPEMLEFRRGLIDAHQHKELRINEDERYLSDWAAKQAYIALGNLMTAAALIKIDSCPVEGFVKDSVTETLKRHNILNANLDVAVFCCLGYRLNPPARPKTRKPVTELVHFIN